MPPPAPRGRGRPGDQLSSAPEPRSQFQFPRMPLAEIQEDMNVYNCPVSRETLKSPSAPDAKNVIDHFIYEVYNKRADDMVQPGFGCLETVDYPELYEEAIPMLHHLRQCQKMFTAAHFDEFGIRDVVAPSRVRFHWQISALINFNKFRQTRLSSFEEMANNADDLINRERSVLSEKSDLQREITVIEDARAAEEPEVASIRETVSELAVEINALHQKQRSLTDQTRDAKGALAQKVDSATALQMRKVGAREEVDGMSARVVASPDRVKGELQDMRDTLGAEKDVVVSMEKRTRALSQRAAGLETAADGVNKAAHAATECVATRDVLQELEGLTEKRGREKREHEMEVQSITQSRAHLERLTESVGTKVARIDEQSLEIDSNCSEGDRKLAEQSKQLEREEEMVRKQLEERGKTARECERQIEEAATSLATDLEVLRAKQELVATNVNEFMADMVKVTDLVQEDNRKYLKKCEESLTDVVGAQYQ